MEQWVNLLELLKEKSKNKQEYEAFTRLYVSYTPDKKSLETTKSFFGSETGTEKKQSATTELFFYHPVLYKEKAYLIACSATECELELSGKLGAENGMRILKKYVTALYGNSELGAKGIPLTKNLYKSLPLFIKKETVNIAYWICSEFNINHKQGLWYASPNGSLIDSMLYVENGKQISVFTDSNSIRPVILLPTNIQVNVGDEIYNGKETQNAFKIRVKPE